MTKPTTRFVASKGVRQRGRTTRSRPCRTGMSRSMRRASRGVSTLWPAMMPGRTGAGRAITIWIAGYTSKTPMNGDAPGISPTRPMSSITMPNDRAPRLSISQFRVTLLCGASSRSFSRIADVAGRSSFSVFRRSAAMDWDLPEEFLCSSGRRQQPATNVHIRGRLSRASRLVLPSQWFSRSHRAFPGLLGAPGVAISVVHRSDADPRWMKLG